MSLRTRSPWYSYTSDAFADVFGFKDLRFAYPAALNALLDELFVFLGAFAARGILGDVRKGVKGGDGGWYWPGRAGARL